MTDKCAYVKCGKDLVHIEGRKKKKYCNPTCKMNAWKAANPAKKPKFKMIPVEEYEKMQNGLAEKKKEKTTVQVIKEVAKRMGTEAVSVTTPKTLEELKAMCPAHLKGFEKSEWISTEKVKYGI